MTEERKIQIPVVVDGTGAKQGFSEVKAAAQDMAQAVSQAGVTASKGVDAIGAGAPAAAAKVDGATRSLIGSIQRTTAVMEAGGRTTAKYYEALAAQRGVSLEALKPYLAQLDAVSAKQGVATAALNTGAAGLNNLGMSAKATTAALRQVPAQFTDIVTSLAAGQRPLQVLLQQGGQLKDVFGGIGPAASALGGYIKGLVNPFSVAALAVGGLIIAQKAGADEAREYAKALVLSGNAVGTTTGQLQGYAENIAKITGNQSKAADALADFAQNGKVGANSLEAFARAALAFEKATGQAVSKTVAQFAELGRSPVEASVKLNEQMNYLTADIYKQIKALEDQGRATAAADLAQKAFADTIENRSAMVIQNLGYIEKAWNGIKGAISGAGSALAGIGRDLTGADQLAILRGQLEARQERNKTLGITDGKGTQELKDQIDALTEIERLQRRSATAQAERAALAKQFIEFDKQGAEFKTKAARRDEAILKAEVEGRALVNAGLLTEAQLRKRIADIRDKFKEGGSGSAGVGQNEVAAINARIKEQTEFLTRLRATPIGADVPTLTQGEKDVARLREELNTDIKGAARAQKELALSRALVAAETDKAVVAEQNYRKALAATMAVSDKQVDAQTTIAERIRDQALNQEAANAAIGKSKTATEQLTLATLQQQLAEAEGSDRFIPAYVAALRQAVEWQTRYADALKDTEAKQLALSNGEWARLVAEEAKTLELEVGLLGMTQQARETIIGQRRVELELAKRIVEIDRSGATPERKAELRSDAEATAIAAKANVTRKAFIDEWQRTADQINNSLTDALLRGFEDGKGFAENFRDTLTNMFKTLVLRPIIQGILAPVTGSIAGLSGGGTAGGAAGSISNLTSVAGAVGQFATGATAGASTASLIGANAVGAVGGDAIGALAALNGGWAGVGTAGAASAAASIASFAAVAGPLALGVIALSGILSKQGETRSGGTYDRLSFVEGPSGGEIGGEAARTAISGTMASINATLKALGSTATLNGFLSGLESSEKGKGFAFAGGSLSTGENFGQFNRTLGVDNRRGSMTPEQANAAFAEELKQATLQALQAADVPGMLGDYLRQLGDIDALSGGALDAALNRINTALTQRTALEARYFDITATEAQKLAKARDAEREATDAFSKALLESIYAREDVVKAVAGARNVLAESYETEKRALETTRDRVLGFSKTLKGFTDGLLIGNLSPLTPAQRYAELGSRYTILKAQASAGDANAREKFPEVAQQFLEASRTLNASGANYQADFARVLADSEGMQSIASKQYDASVAALSKLDLQVAGLIDIKGAVMTVAEAIYALAGAGGGQTIDPIQKLYSELLGRSPDAEGGAYFRSKLAVGVSEATIRQDIMNSPEYKRLRGIPLATGLDTVPYDGFRATLHAEETVLNRDAARAWRAGMSGGDSGALVAEVSALRKEVAELRKENRADALAVAQSHAIAVDQSADKIVSGTKGNAKAAAFDQKNTPAYA